MTSLVTIHAKGAAIRNRSIATQGFNRYAQKTPSAPSMTSILSHKRNKQ